MNIVFCTTVKNRTFHLSETLPQNLADNPRSKFVVLNYSTQDDLLDYLFSFHKSEIESGRLTVYSHLNQPVFHMSHAKSMAMRCGILEGADILVTLDADNFAGRGFEDFIEERFARERNIFLCPRVVALGTAQVRIAPRGVAGRLAIRTQDFIKAGGYDEKYDTWHGEDVDLVARLRRMGLAPRMIDPIFLDAIRHGDYIRFKEYPHAKQYENDEEVRQINEAKHTIVNFGNFGCGAIYRNWNGVFPLYELIPTYLKPLPTRIFGIGFQRTATTSLHEAFKILGLDSFHWETGDKARDIWDEMNEYGKSWTLERHYALSDNPIPLLYQKLDLAYPGSKFILTVRDEDDWLQSVERLWDRNYNPSRWEWDVWPFSNRIHRAIYGRTDFDPETFLARYRQHTVDVIEYFCDADRPSDLLIMRTDKGDGWPELCNFLDVPIPSVPYPYANGRAKTLEESEMKTKYQRRQRQKERTAKMRLEAPRDGWVCYKHANSGTHPNGCHWCAKELAAQQLDDDLTIPPWPASTREFPVEKITMTLSKGAIGATVYHGDSRQGEFVAVREPVFSPELEELLRKDLAQGQVTKFQALKSWLSRVFFFWRRTTSGRLEPPE